LQKVSRNSRHSAANASLRSCPSAPPSQVVFFAFFAHAITPPFAAQLSDTEPSFRREIKNRTSVSL
jgi:hypothetical protein